MGTQYQSPPVDSECPECQQFTGSAITAGLVTEYQVKVGSNKEYCKVPDARFKISVSECEKCGCRFISAKESIPEWEYGRLCTELPEFDGRIKTGEVQLGAIVR